MREKIAVTRGEIAAIRMQLARMKENVAVPVAGKEEMEGKEKMEGKEEMAPMAGKKTNEPMAGKEETPATMPPPATETPMQPPAKILRLKSNRPLPEKVTISRVDTSDFKVVEGPTKTKKPAQSGAYLSSFGSVLSALQTGSNHSYDEQPEPVVVSSTPVAVTVEMDPARGRQQRRRKVPQQAPSEPVTVMEKPRDMKDYHVPEDMNVAINKEALDEVVQELGSNQPAFMKRMIEELKGK